MNSGRRKRKQGMGRRFGDGLRARGEHQRRAEAPKQMPALHQKAPILKGALSAVNTFGTVTVRVYPLPGWSMLRSANVATPFTTFTVFVPASVPGISVPPLRPIA